jgi:ABC-2 type transport system permease protein
MTSLDTDLTAAPTAAPEPTNKARPFYWSLRRELWEHRSIWVAPAAVAALILLGYLLGSVGLPNRVRRAEMGMPNSLELPYAVAIAASFIAAALSGAYYCLTCLQGERRDRSILFWKSLPVSDRTTILAKAAMPMVVQPVAVFAIILASHMAMLIWGTFVMLVSNNNPSPLWVHGFPGYMWAAVAVGLPYLALWHAPVIAWLMLVSAWARRATFLWAIIPPVMLGVLERMAFDTSHVFHFIGVRLMGGLAHTASVGGRGDNPVRGFRDIDLGRMLSDPNLWIGLVLAALLFEGAVRLRRRREPN